ncbi:TPA: hypothetical protein I7747_01725 [Vibrio vulnificus]|nr:hypothetical protein [Vibrio vulnificus]
MQLTKKRDAVRSSLPIMDGAIHKRSIKEQTKTRMQEHGEKSGSRKDKKGTYAGAFSIVLSFTHEKGIFV